LADYYHYVEDSLRALLIGKFGKSRVWVVLIACQCKARLQEKGYAERKKG